MEFGIYEGHMITKENLIKAGFNEEVVDGRTIYTRGEYSVLYNRVAWHPCTIVEGKAVISNIFLETMKELEELIIESKSM